jgi:hypothetical protein
MGQLTTRLSSIAANLERVIHEQAYSKRGKRPLYSMKRIKAAMSTCRIYAGKENDNGGKRGRGSGGGRLIDCGYVDKGD